MKAPPIPTPREIDRRVVAELHERIARVEAQAAYDRTLGTAVRWHFGMNPVRPLTRVNMRGIRLQAARIHRLGGAA